jgi:hypothetical protein
VAGFDQVRPGLSLSLNVALFLAATGCASGAGAAAAGGATPAAELSFEEALMADSSTFEPTTGFRAVAEDDWASAALTGTLAAPNMDNSRWRLRDDCEVHFTTEADVLAASESAPLATRKLDGTKCLGHTGFWQISAGRVFWWMPLAGGWSVEYYGDFVNDSTMLLRRYPLRRTGARSWRAEREAAVTGRASRIVEVRVVKATYEVTAALSAVGEPDWATRPGAGSAPSVSGTNWRMENGCVLAFATTVLARATRTQRLTRALNSTECEGLKGSWQQQGKRVFWRLNVDSLTAIETYADVADTLMRARHFDLSRSSTTEAFQGIWDPQRSQTLVRVRR